MTTSVDGINLIKRFEGVRLTAYKAIPEERYYTIGYGHYGADVSKDMQITQNQADAYLKADLIRYENTVKNTVKIALNQHQFDALVSFTYNCGASSLKSLVSGRTARQIAEKLPSYCCASGRKLEGLVRRRYAEKELFLKEDISMDQYVELKQQISNLQAQIECLKPTYYDWTKACPEWAQPYVHTALAKGIIKGDEQGRLRLTDDKISNLVVTMRATGIMK